MIVARIDRDYIAEPDEQKEIGTEWEIRNDWQMRESDFEAMEKISRFRLKDDDGIIYYGGWLYDDPYAEVQSDILEWGRWNAGCTTIEVKRNDEWIQDIG